MGRHALTLLGVAIMAGGLLSSCGSRDHAQVIADARAAAQAIQQTVSPEGRAAIASGLAAQVIAATEAIPGLPHPSLSPAAIVAQPAEYAAQAAKDQEAPPAYGMPKPAADAPPSPLALLLAKWGERMTMYGSAILGFCLLVLLACMIPAVRLFVGRFVEWLDELAIAGLVLLLLGASLRWLGAHTWVIYTVGAAVLITYAIRHRSVWLPAAKRAVKCGNACPIPKRRR